MSSIEKTISVSLTVKNTANAISFYEKAFDAKELYRIPLPDAGIAHAEFMIKDTRVFISDQSEDWNAKAIEEGKVASSLLVLLTEDCDQSFKQAISAGAKKILEPADNFFGVRVGVVKDPFGYRWSFRQVLEEVSNEEIQRRAKELFGT